jgi:beta-glucosidase
MMEEIVALGKPTVLVLMSGSPMSITWAQEHVDAILDVWYPGETGGTAIADVLFGKVSPAGRLPITFPKCITDVPAFSDYSMRGRTYRYLEKEPLYPFGYGLSYTTFDYSELEVTPTRLPAGESVGVSVVVENTGKNASDEVVELYLKDLEASCVIPQYELRGFSRVHLASGERKRVCFTLTERDLSLIDLEGKRVLEPGLFRVYVGGSQPDDRSVALLGRAPITAEFELLGDRRELPY